MFFLTIFSYGESCVFHFQSIENEIYVEIDDNRCAAPFFSKENGFEKVYCLEDIRKECEQYKKNTGIQCPFTLEDVYAFDYESLKDILYALEKKGKVSLQKDGERIHKIFEAHYKMYCHISGVDGGELGTGLFVSKDGLLSKRVEGYIW